MNGAGDLDLEIDGGVIGGIATDGLVPEVGGVVMVPLGSRPGGDRPSGDVQSRIETGVTAVKPVDQLVGGIGIVLDLDRQRVTLQRKALQAERIEKPSLDPDGLVLPAVRQGDRLGVGLVLG